jgi:membrane protein
MALGLLAVANPAAHAPIQSNGIHSRLMASTRLMFKFLPDVKIGWREVWLGAVITAALFELGKFALGLYLGKSDIGSAYGAAGSIIIVLLWVYYSAMILLMGAEITQAMARHLGKEIRPAEGFELQGEGRQTKRA